MKRHEDYPIGVYIGQFVFWLVVVSAAFYQVLRG